LDELAHTNVPGSRHTKDTRMFRKFWKTASMFIQHLMFNILKADQKRSLKLPEYRVRETVPDELFENADEVELVDLTPEELLQRLKEGKVYSPEQSKEAIENFFRKG
jgi:two-component system sensor histidine kinase KdpD